MTSSALRPVRLLREDEVVKVRYLDSNTEFLLDAAKPVQMLHTVTANDDSTMVEVMDQMALAVCQVDEEGAVQTIVLSPRMALELSRLLDSFVFFPTGFRLE